MKKMIVLVAAASLVASAAFAQGARLQDQPPASSIGTVKDSKECARVIAVELRGSKLDNGNPVKAASVTLAGQERWINLQRDDDPALLATCDIAIATAKTTANTLVGQALKGN